MKDHETPARRALAEDTTRREAPRQLADPPANPLPSAAESQQPFDTHPALQQPSQPATETLIACAPEQKPVYFETEAQCSN